SLTSFSITFSRTTVSSATTPAASPASSSKNFFVASPAVPQLFLKTSFGCHFERSEKSLFARFPGCEGHAGREEKSKKKKGPPIRLEGIFGSCMISG